MKAIKKPKIDWIEKDGKYLNIYIKFPYFRRFVDYYPYFEQFEDSDNFLGACLESDCKHIVMTFILRNKDDILPYVNLKEKGE